MRTYRLLASIAACSSAVLAQNAPAVSIGVKPAATPADPAVQTVIVGGFQPAATAGGQPIPQMAFTPDTINAQPGDTVRFLFLGNNHSVVQTSVNAPCQPAANGFNTGFKPNMNNDLASAPTADLQVPTTPGPLYMSTLEQANCGVGMVFTLNPPPEGQPGSQSSFMDAAIRSVNPGLKQAAIVAAAAPAQVMSTVSINPGAVNAAQPTAAAGTNPGTVVQGTGKTGNGQPCSCSCLCGAGAPPPPNAAMGNFGGIAGEMPLPAAGAGAMSPANMAPMRLVRAVLEKRHHPPLY